MLTTLSVRRIVAARVLAAVGLVLVGWFDYSATRRDLMQLLRSQASALRQTVAAAAVSNEAAGGVASAQISERLLDNARLLAELDRKGALSQAFLDQIASRNKLFRVAVFAKDGTREAASGGGPGLGRGQGGGGRGPRQGAGGGAGLAAGRGGQSGQGLGPGSGPGWALVERLFSGDEQEIVSEVHEVRSGAGARTSAAVRRGNGGAILVNADASGIEALLRQTSLQGLLEKIASGTPQLAYIVLDRAGTRLARGEVPGGLPEVASGAAAGATPGDVVERQVELSGRPVLEFASRVEFGTEDSATLRLGLRLDEVRRAEQRMLTRLAASLASALVLSLLALGAIWLRQAYGALTEKHARAEAALRRRDRLSAMGELASTVAHEVRNPLNAIAMSAQRLRREFLAAVSPADPGAAPGVVVASPADREELAQLLHVVEGETGRINDIVQRFLEFARPPRLAPSRGDLGSELNALVEALRPFAGSRDVALEADLDAAGSATFDRAQMRQALDNLVRNAIEATPPGGRVLVRARTGAKGHEVEVRDTGAGIAPEDLPKIFDLYFTTKPQGTGVGLAVTQQIVAAHGGTIEVDSEPGRGTAMTVRLPADIEGAVDA